MKRWLKRIFLVDPYDPVYHCRVYKLVGCAFVDGMLCDMRTCNIKVDLTVTPFTLSEVTDACDLKESSDGKD